MLKSIAINADADFFTCKKRRKNMINTIIENIAIQVTESPFRGFCSFLASFFVSITPSFIEPHLLCQVQSAETVITIDIIVKLIQIVAGMLGIVLSSVMIYVNIPKVKQVFNNGRKAKKISRRK